MNKTHKKRLANYKKKLVASKATTKTAATNVNRKEQLAYDAIEALEVHELVSVLKKLSDEKLKLLFKGIKLISYGRGLRLP